ncbi:MAG: hypothetical protein ACUZ8N_08190 [Candidatus Scalindua sp.]
MFIRKIINVVGLVLVSLIAQEAFAFAGEEVYHLEAVSGKSVIGLPEKAIDLKTIREREERGLNLAKRAIKLADPYPGMKTEVNMRNKELNNLTEKKSNLKMTIQRLKIGLMRKKAKFARNPELLKISVKQYSQKIAEMEDELAEVEKQIPVLESKLESVTIEVEAEELKRGIMKDEEDTGGFDEEFEEAIQGRWEVGKALLNQGF